MKTIKLTQNKIALVDDDDFERLSKFKWCAYRAGNTWYAQRYNGPRKTMLMHREVFNVKSCIDHKNGNGLDNRKENLRVATTSQNARNKIKNKQRNGKPCSSIFKGVSIHRPSGKWQAHINNGDGQKYLGLFTTQKDAAKVYDTNAYNLFGDFASLNFPKETMVAT